MGALSAVPDPLFLSRIRPRRSTGPRPWKVPYNNPRADLARTHATQTQTRNTISRLGPLALSPPNPPSPGSCLVRSPQLSWEVSWELVLGPQIYCPNPLFLSTIRRRGSGARAGDPRPWKVRYNSPRADLARTHARNASTNTKHDFPVAGRWRTRSPNHRGA